MKITKEAFVKTVAERTGLSIYRTEKVLDAIIDEIKQIVTMAGNSYRVSKVLVCLTASCVSATRRSVRSVARLWNIQHDASLSFSTSA